MKKQAHTNYIDRHGIPHGDWRRIIGNRLAAWNWAQDEKDNHTNKED